MRSRLFEIPYIAAIVVAMIGWVWVLVEGVAWTVA
jgi:hypothetical protein